MAEPSQLPDLPLMLADVPRTVAALLQEAGIPAEALPDIPLLAAGVGQFVLFDPHHPRSAALARRALAQGLKLIDLREILEAADDRDPLSFEDPAKSASARAFLERLKAAVEMRGGVWVRVADYPFPYQSALCLGVEHVSEELAGFAEIAAALPGKATHFVSSRLRPERLEFLSQAGAIDLGWQIQPADFAASPRSTLAQWATRMEHFHAANLHPAGLAFANGSGTLPACSRLLPLGLRYACCNSPGIATDAGVSSENSPGITCRADTCSRAAAERPWIRFSTLSLPPRDAILELVAEHYQSGSPLLLSATSERLDLFQELLRLAGDAGRCSLMWQTSFGDFSRWWGLRRQLRLQVWRKAEGYEIHATGECGPYPWAIEVWRGSHLAILPMRNPELVVPDDGLVYRQSSRRNPAGGMAPGEGVRNLSLSQKREGLLGPFLTRSRFRRKGSPE